MEGATLERSKRSVTNTMRPPPGPHTPVALQLVERFTRPGPYARRMARRYGHVYMLRMPGGERVAQVSDPEVIKQIFTASPQTYELGTSGSALLEPLVGTASLLTLDGTKHMRHRKLLLPPLHGERMRDYASLMVDFTERSMRDWPRGEPFAIHTRMREITLDVILRAVFGLEEGEHDDELREQLRRILDLGQNTIAFAPWIRHWMHRPWVKFLALRERVDDLIYREITQRRSVPDLDQRDDILSLLLRARYEDGSPMSDKELRDELITMLVAGHETTATALAWAFDLLLHDKPALDRLLGSLDQGDEYLDAVITETLRIRPVIAQVSRMTVEPFRLGRYTVPAGTLLAINIALVHSRPDLYPEPERFRPERFLEDGPETYSWLPFGGGVRRCAGAAFASFEMRTVLRTILGNARLRTAGPELEKIAFRAVTQAPKNGTQVIVEQSRV